MSSKRETSWNDHTLSSTISVHFCLGLGWYGLQPIYYVYYSIRTLLIRYVFDAQLKVSKSRIVDFNNKVIFFRLIYTLNLTNTSAGSKMVTCVVCTIVLFTKYKFNIIKIKLNMLKFSADESQVWNDTSRLSVWWPYRYISVDCCIDSVPIVTVTPQPYFCHKQ